MILISVLFVKINTSICIVSRIKFCDYDYVLLQYHKPGSNARSFSCQRICSLHGGEVYQTPVFVGGDFSVVQQKKHDPFSLGLSEKDR